MTVIDPGSVSAVDQLFDELYDTYGKPLEDEHAGAFLAVSPEGRTVLGPTLIEVAHRAVAELGAGCFLYKIGARAVGAWY